MKTFHYVTFNYGGKTWYAVRGQKPIGLAQPESRCLFKKEQDAKELERFLARESTFQGIARATVSV